MARKKIVREEIVSAVTEAIGATDAPDIQINGGTTEVTEKAKTRKPSKKSAEVAAEKAAAAAKRAEAREAKAKAKAEKPKREPSPYAGLSQHQRNRRIAWDKYGPESTPYDEHARYVIEPGLRAEIHAELAAGTVRPSAKGTSFGGDRYLNGVARRKWPEGAITILTGDALAERKAEAEAAKGLKAQEAAAAKEAKAAEREAAKQAKAAEREAAKQAKAQAKLVANAESAATQEPESTNAAAEPVSDFEAE